MAYGCQIQVLQSAVWTMRRGDTCRSTQPQFHWFIWQILLVLTRACAFVLCKILENWFGHFWKIDLAILQKYYVLTLESYAYLNYNLFSNKGHFSQMQSLFTNKLLVTAHLGSSGWMALHSYFLEDRQAADQHKIGILYANDDNLLYLEIDEHEHTWMILRFKAQPVFVFKEMS